MIIEKIELENFMCYAGKSSMTFRDGINVIIGDNGYGKSKLYDAFYWVLYDQVFVPEKKEFQNTKSVKSKIISDKAKSEIFQGRITCSVKITFHNSETDNAYILERRYSAEVSNGVLNENNDSELIVMQKELSYLNARLITDEDRKRTIINQILPAQIKDYLWFQGEQVESIIDFNKQDTLTKAINVLSSISRYDELKEIAASAAKAANLEFDREVKRLSKDTEKSVRLEGEKAKWEGVLTHLKSQEKELSENLSRAETTCEQLLNKQADAQEVSKLKERKKGVYNLLNQLNDNLKEEQVSFHRRMFRSKWVLKGTSKLYEEYSKKFSVYEGRKLELMKNRAIQENVENEVNAQLKTRLPINVPEPNYLEWMLEQQKCLVCNREAKNGTEPWLRIKELLDRPAKTVQPTANTPLTLHDFSSDLKRLYQNGLSLTGRIPEIDDDINETLQRRFSLLRRVREANRDLGKIDEEIEKLLSDTSLTAEEATNILNEYSIQNKKSKDFKDELNEIIQQIDHARIKLRTIDDQLKDLVTGEIPYWLIEKKSVLNDFEAIATSTRDRVFNTLIHQLEVEANTHYEAMTSGNRSSRGQIKLRKLPNGNYMPEIIDNNGNPLLGSNTSNLILVKLATIMAIVSAKSSSGLVDLYTLITDAPTSVFGEDYTIGFCKTVSKVYRQSIIMSKEFYKNEKLRNELLTNPEIKIGNVYSITPNIPESERNNRNSLSTKIEALN